MNFLKTPNSKIQTENPTKKTEKQKNKTLSFLKIEYISLLIDGV